MTIYGILQAFSTRFGTTLPDLTGRSLSKSLVNARHLAMWLVRDMTGASYPEIGRAFLRDHSTVMNGCRNAELLLACSAELREAVEAVRRAVLAPEPEGLDASSDRGIAVEPSTTRGPRA